jgi:hypothetical protein
MIESATLPVYDCFDLTMFREMAGCRTLPAQKSAKTYHERGSDL